ncbi:MAG: hypothetical protein LBK96_06515, partial [Prevotellaceae bacterium]|nr:hypothetical protein [Prevotellaceae bacterium]
MINELITRYRTIDEDSRRIVNLLALTTVPLNQDEIAKRLPDVKQSKIRTILQNENTTGLITHDYNRKYITNISMTVWLFPVICDRNVKIYHRGESGFFYSQARTEWLLNYLNALCFYPNKLEAAEKEIFSHVYGAGNNFLSPIFLQPAYEAYIPRLSDDILFLIYTGVLSETISEMKSFEQLRQMDDKIQGNTSLSHLQTQVAIIRGDFEQARKYAAFFQDEALNYFVEAIFAFINRETDSALSLFEQGLKKQRRKVKNRYMPLLPEITLFYLAACMSKGQDYYVNVFRKITNEKGNMPSDSYTYFSYACECCIKDDERSEKLVGYLKEPRDKAAGAMLWKIVALGFTGASLDEEQETSYYISHYLKDNLKKAFENGYYVVAYEAAYLLSRWFPSPEYRQLLKDISAHVNHMPALSRVTHPDEWEKQLNSWFTLEAVRMVIQKEADNGKTRVGYRFFPDYAGATPILQTRNAAGIWSAGRNIALKNFGDTKIDSMTEQDKRIASFDTQYASTLSGDAIFEMIGHPRVYLRDSNITVELVAAQPVISVVKSANNDYIMDCDIKKPREGISVMKETNTRYKIYRLTQFHCDIIRAVLKSRPIPERGYEKLIQLLKHFSMYVQVHSDFALGGEDDAQLRQVETDSRIRVQLLPMGEGFKAELFVKPFGSHPPYCKPGRGGKALIATENGERLRVIRNLDDENAYGERIYNDIQSIEDIRTSDDGLMVFDNPLDSLELLDVLDRHRDIAVVEWPEGERLKIRKKITDGDFSFRLKSNANWFELEGELKIDEDTVLTIGALLEMVRNSRGRFVELSKGEFLALGDQLRRRLSELAAYTPESKDAVAINRFASAAMMDTFDEFENFKADRAWLNFRKRLQTVELTDAPVPPLLQAELRPYQVSAYKWMIRLSEWGAGA